MEDQTEKQLMQHGEIITDLILRVTTLEKLLVSKNLISEAELNTQLEIVRNEFIELVKKELDKKEG